MKRWICGHRRIFVLLMAVMMLSLFSVTDGRGNVSLAAQEEDHGLVDSGSCGVSATWEFYSDGKLQITGTGEMSFESAPWKDYRKRITSVVIGAGITTLGNKEAFRECSSLTDVEIPDSVTGLGEYTFTGCSSLTSINIPANVTEIGVYTFSSCSSLTDIEIPDGVTNIDDFAFVGCASLTSIEIPDSVTNIGQYAFSMCSSLTGIKIPAGVTNIGDWTGEGNAFSECSSLESIEVAEGNSKYDSREKCNAIIETSSNTLITGCKNTTIPNSVTSIRGHAFEGCTGLTDIEIPDSVTAIGRQAFSECTSLLAVNIPKSLTSIEKSAFYYCSSLERIEVAEENSKYDSRGNCNAIIEKTGNTLVIGCKSTVIPESVTAIGDSAFYECSSLTSLEIPAGVTSIGNFAFYGCTTLKSINIPDGVTSIGTEVFNGCSSLTSIEIPGSVTSIGNQAFKDCSSLTSIEIPNSVTSIGSHVFSGCSGLESIKVAEENSKYDDRGNCNAIIETSSNTLITGCKNTIIPESVTGIGRSAFADNSGLTSLKIPAGVTSIATGGFRAFVGCNGLERIEVAEGNSKYDSRDNCNAIIETSSNKLLAGCKATVIPSSVTGIGEYAFYYCSRLTSIKIPAGVTNIEGYAFTGCSSLTDIEIPASVTSIEDTAFYKLTGLTIWGLPDSYAEEYAKIEGIPFKTIRYDVRFVSDGQIIETQSVEYGKSATAPADVVKEGYTLSGWDKGFTEIKEDTTVNAVWTINEYQVTFQDGDIILDTQTVEHGKAVTAPTVQPKEGYTFSWDKDFEEIKADTTVNAVWTVNKYQVTFQDGDKVLDTQEVEYGKAAAEPTVQLKEGYTLSWDKDFAKIKADTTVNAVWTINEYQVTFQDGDSILKTQTVEHGKAAKAPSVTPREGYTFSWDKDFEEIKADTTVNAVWTVNKYQVTFQDGDKVLDTQEVEYGKAATAPKDVVKEGYTLSGWDKGFTEIKEDTTVNAVWTAKEGIKKYRVIFKDGDKVLDTQEVEHGKAATAPTVQPKKGYTFSWDKAFTEIKEDTTVNAVWTANGEMATEEPTTTKDPAATEKPTATKDPAATKKPTATKDPTATEKPTATKDPTATEKPAATKDPTATEDPAATEEPAVTEEPTKKFQVIFKDGDQVLGVQEVEYGKAATAPAVAPKEGYTLSWDKAFTEIKEDTAVNAVWTAEQYTVQFEKNGGSMVSESPITVTYNGEYGILPTAVRKKYIFLGWYTAKSGGNEITSSTKVSAAGNHTLYAHWEKVKTGKASIKKVKAGKRKMTVTLGKISGVKGYQIVYSANKKFKSAKKVRVTSTKAVIKKLKSKKTIYVKVRAYKLDSAGSKVYGKFSPVKRVKIK